MNWDVQLPPQIKTDVSKPLSRGISSESLEKNASHAVIEANGKVAASSKEMLFGTRKLIRSSAREYSLYAPRPLTSPVVMSDSQ